MHSIISKKRAATAALNQVMLNTSHPLNRLLSLVELDTLHSKPLGVAAENAGPCHLGNGTFQMRSAIAARVPNFPNMLPAHRVAST
jgi:hypothetical protein